MDQTGVVRTFGCAKAMTVEAMIVELSNRVKVFESSYLTVAIDLGSNRYYKINDRTLRLLKKLVKRKGPCALSGNELKSARVLLKLGLITRHIDSDGRHTLQDSH
jgi:hypothetical protein